MLLWSGYTLGIGNRVEVAWSPPLLRADDKWVNCLVVKTADEQAAYHFCFYACVHARRTEQSQKNFNIKHTLLTPGAMDGQFFCRRYNPRRKSSSRGRFQMFMWPPTNYYCTDYVSTVKVPVHCML